MKTLSVRGQITALVAFAALPALALFSYEAIQERREAEAVAQADLGRLVKLAAQQQAQLVEGARLMLAAIARTVHSVRNDPGRCRQFFAEMVNEGRGLFHSAGLSDADGNLVCNGFPANPAANAGDRRWFRFAKQTGEFSIGAYQQGRVTGQQGLNFGFPIRDGNTLTGVAFVAMNLPAFDRIAANTPLPENGMLTVVDHDGTLLARYPEAAGRIGQKLRNPAVIEAFRAGRPALFRTQRPDGVDVLLAVEIAARDASGSPAIGIVMSVPLASVYAHADRDFVRNLSGLAIATLILLAVAWYGTEHYVLRNIRALVSAASRMSTGDMSARTGLAQRGGELAEVGRAFDRMASALQARDSELKQTLSVAQVEAATDALTGLPNRRYLDEFLPRELRRARRNRKTLAAIMLDLDHFKRFNDSFGHEAGDAVLRAIGAVLRDNIRGSDLPCRYGGEEFTVVLLDVSAEGARRKAEEIRLAIQAIHAVYAHRPLGTVTVSQGLALFPDHAGNASSLMRAADAALYQAKAWGRNRVVVIGDSAPKDEDAAAQDSGTTAA